MNAVIIACSSLKDYIAAAMESQNVSFPVLFIDRVLHADPDKMKEEVRRTILNLEPSVDTVLVAMGFCGGVWDQVTYPVRVVIPRTDDCVSMLLHTDDNYLPNRKADGHLYVYEKNPAEFVMLNMAMEDEYGLNSGYEGISDEMLFHMYFDQYYELDIIDTGLNDCYSEEYVMAVQESADKIDAQIDFVEGSNRLLEKLVSGRWDEQFIVSEPGIEIRHAHFF